MEAVRHINLVIQTKKNPHKAGSVWEVNREERLDEGSRQAHISATRAERKEKPGSTACKPPPVSLFGQR